MKTKQLTKTRKFVLLLILLIFCLSSGAQEVPSVYSNVGSDEKGVFLLMENRKIYALPTDDEFQFRDLYGNPLGTHKGILLDFKFPHLKGKLYYGFINYKDGSYPQPVYFHSEVPIFSGKAAINIADVLSGKYDMIGWEKTGKGVLGYRIVTDKGEIIYDGKIAFSYHQGTFATEPTIIEGPLINNLTPKSVTISFTTTKPVVATIKVNNKTYKDRKATLDHEIKIKGLQPQTKYDYTLVLNQYEFSYGFETAPKPGSRKRFTFAYASDSRTGPGGGERDIWGTNAYIMKKIAALSIAEGAKFVQFTGDLINGYDNSMERMNLQYANWKHAVEPFWHHIPFITAFGNHEAYVFKFHNPQNNHTYMIDHFPFGNNSAEAIFQNQFVHPNNGPHSEDGSKYDPNPGVHDFPSYKETTFWYSYDNVAMIVLNSNYWYTPSGVKKFSGNLHAFVMDNQVKWLEKTLNKLEKNEDIDHIFITIHTPFFPNGGHISNDMWYNGNNSHRAYVKGEAYNQGIIQRRDQLLDIIINKSSKTVALLTGDEHNYNLLTLTNETERYPQDYKHDKIELSRIFYQINNGAAGAPYYAIEQTPWTNQLRNFSTQNALVLIDIDGSKIYVRIKNPDTLELIDEYPLRE